MDVPYVLNDTREARHVGGACAGCVGRSLYALSLEVGTDRT